METFKDMRKVKKGKRYRNAYELPATIRKYAAFSSGAYDKKNKKIRGYTLDEQLSTDQFRIFTKGEGGKVVFAIRGSSTEAAWNDFVVNDLRGIAAGNEHLQLQQAREKLEEVLQLLCIGSSVICKSSCTFIKRPQIGITRFSFCFTANNLYCFVYIS